MVGPYENILSLIGNTPIVRLEKMSKDIPAEIWAKLEFYNPSGSVKDRIALRMLEEAEKRGVITRGAVIVEPTSGNTGIGLALVCALKGYQMIAVMPEAMSDERKMLMEYLGAKVELVPSCGKVEQGFTKEDIENTLKKAAEIVEGTPNSYMPNQFENPDNPAVHAETTAVEMLEQTGAKFDAFVAACGTGGTFSGVAEVLKSKCPDIERVVVEPSGSAVLSGCEAGFHKIQGIGEGFIPCTMNAELADRVIQVDDNDSIVTAHRLAREEGILTGISGGANVFASLEVGKSLARGQVVMTIIPDNAFRYFSTELFRI
jgi:cysteine synthase A